MADDTSPSPSASVNSSSPTKSPSATSIRRTFGNASPSAGQTARIISVPAAQKPKPTFTLSIKADPTSAQTYPSLHRVSVTFTNISSRILVSRFHPESKNMYNMVVTRDGAPVPGTAAMKALQQYRRVDNHPTIRHPALLYPGRSVTTSLDVGDYYNMTQPGTYRVTITRPSLPSNLPYSTQVRSNTISFQVQ